MRVIAGTYKGRKLESPENYDIRPTTDKAKEALFSILMNDVPGSRVLDLFAGSGGIGIEALSRGARFAVFVDNSPKAIRCIQENLAHTKLADDALVLQKNAISGIRELALRNYRFDLVFMDPPYQSGVEEETLKALAASGIIDQDTLVIIEAERHNTLDFIDHTNFEVIRVKDYKTNKHYFLQIRS